MAKYSKSAEQGGGKGEYHFFFFLYSDAKGAFWYASLSCEYFFFYLKPKYLLHKNSGIVVLYATINSPRVKHCIFFAELPLKALI